MSKAQWTSTRNFCSAADLIVVNETLNSRSLFIRCCKYAENFQFFEILTE